MSTRTCAVGPVRRRALAGVQRVCGAVACLRVSARTSLLPSRVERIFETSTLRGKECDAGEQRTRGRVG